MTKSKKPVAKAKKKSRPSTPKPKLVPKAVILSTEEIHKLEKSVEEMGYLKRAHENHKLALKKEQALAALKAVELEEAKVQVGNAFEEIQGIESRFANAEKYKNTIVADICEKRGIAYQELSYTADGVVTNLGNSGVETNGI